MNTFTLNVVVRRPPSWFVKQWNEHERMKHSTFNARPDVGVKVTGYYQVPARTEGAPSVTLLCDEAKNKPQWFFRSIDNSLNDVHKSKQHQKSSTNSTAPGANHSAKNSSTTSPLDQFHCDHDNCLTPSTSLRASPYYACASFIFFFRSVSTLVAFASSFFNKLSYTLRSLRLMNTFFCATLISSSFASREDSWTFLFAGAFTFVATPEDTQLFSITQQGSCLQCFHPIKKVKPWEVMQLLRTTGCGEMGLWMPIVKGNKALYIAYLTIDIHKRNHQATILNIKVHNTSWSSELVQL
jgi:hypothetical protein